MRIVSFNFRTDFKHLFNDISDLWITLFETALKNLRKVIINRSVIKFADSSKKAGVEGSDPSYPRVKQGWGNAIFFAGQTPHLTPLDPAQGVWPRCLTPPVFRARVWPLILPLLTRGKKEGWGKKKNQMCRSLTVRPFC